jgi:2-octaprenylphenol hydroxylase
MKHEYDVVVVGGGIVGLTAALAMEHCALKVAVLDARALTIDTTVKDARVYALNARSQSLFQSLGVWNTLDMVRLSPYQHMHIWDSVSSAHIDFDARMVGEAQLGFIIEEAIIKEALLKTISSKAIASFAEFPVESVLTTAEGVTLSFGKEILHAKLMIVADGRASPTCKLLNVPFTEWSYHQDAIVALVKTEISHQKTAFQVFNPDGPLALLPLKDKHHCSIVWSTTPARAQELMISTDEVFEQTLTAAFEERLGCLELIGARYRFPLKMRHAENYTGQHWILMGDAAHTIHPLAGLGLNVGLSDVACWLEILGHDKLQRLKKKQGAYQRQRKYNVWQTIALMEGLKAIFANPLPPFTVLRGGGLRAVNSFTPLKRFFIRHAAG